MIVNKSGNKYIGYFNGNVYRVPETDSFEELKKIKNSIPKEKIISHIRGCLLGLAPCGSNIDVITGERCDVGPGRYEDGPFRIPSEFPYYMEKYGIGIPEEYETYLRETVGLK